MRERVRSFAALVALFLVRCSSLKFIPLPWFEAGEALLAETFDPASAMVALDDEWRELLEAAPQLAQPLAEGALHSLGPLLCSRAALHAGCSDLLVPSLPCRPADIVPFAAIDIPACAVVPLMCYAEYQQWLWQRGDGDVGPGFWRELRYHFMLRVLVQKTVRFSPEDAQLAYRCAGRLPG